MRPTAAKLRLMKGALLALLGIALAHAAEPTVQPLPRLETGMHTALINRIATDVAGRWAVTASDDKTARVWDLADPGKPAQVLRPPQGVGNEGKLYAVALSPDGETVAVGGWISPENEREAIYLFERGSGKLLRRLGGLPSVIQHIAFSPDGRWLAASLGGNGVRLFDWRSGRETGRDTDYGDASYSVAFSADGRRLLATCYDGALRLYALDGGALGPAQQGRPGGGKRPFSARFSPDGRHVAVGFSDSTVVQVLDARTLRELARPDTGGVGNGDLANVAWTTEGRLLVAAGRWSVDGKHPARRWRVGDWSPERDLPLADNTVMDFAPLPDGALLFAAGGPSWGVLDAAGAFRLRYDPAIADLRGPDRLRLSPDARQVRFVDERSGTVRNFDLASRSLGGDITTLQPAQTTGLKIERWEDYRSPILDGKPIELKPYETSRSLAIAPDGQRFVLGTDWWLRHFDRSGKPTWATPPPVPGVAWAVNYSRDGRFVVAAYADGTIRWHRAGDGSEVLALFAHADGKRWIVWTPQGFYAASGPDAEELFGYHLNRGRDREGEFVSARQLREHLYQPGLISRRLDANGDRLLDEAVAKLGDVRQLLAVTPSQAPPPVVELLSDAAVTTDRDVQVKVRLRGTGRLIYRLDTAVLEGRSSSIVGDGTESRTFTPAAPGPHEITVSAMDARGVETRPLRIAVDVRRAAAPPTLHVLAIGISAYRDRELQKGVRFAAADAQAVGELFERQGARLYGKDKVKVQVLPDSQASGDAIRAALTRTAAAVAPQDVFVLYLAGHGASFDREYHFIPQDAVYTSAAALRQRSLTSDHFRELLKAIPATKSLVLLDTCASGAFGRQDGREVGQKDAIDRLSRLTGRVIIAATADDKMALEGEGGHGAFTFALLEGLQGKADRNGNGTVEVRELADHIEERLPQITRKWGYEQFPFSSTEGQSFTLVPKR